MLGNSLKDSVIGFVGAGRIGVAILERLRAFKVKQFLYCGTNQKPSVDSLGARFVSFNELLENSDFVIVSCSLNDKTRHIIQFHKNDLKRPLFLLIQVVAVL
jgi:glyoxylate/hydroxypyruvate reductase